MSTACVICAERMHVAGWGLGFEELRPGNTRFRCHADNHAVMLSAHTRSTPTAFVGSQQRCVGTTTTVHHEFGMCRHVCQGVCLIPATLFMPHWSKSSQLHSAPSVLLVLTSPIP